MLRFSVAMVFGLATACGVAFGINPPAEPPSGDLGLLQGNWKPLSIEYEGKSQMPSEELAKITAVFDQSEYHLYHVDRSKQPPVVRKSRVANVTLNPTTDPKSFTFTSRPLGGGEHKPEVRHGIYAIAGNELRLCYGPADKPRPTQFAAPANSGLFLEVWAKQPAK